MSSYCVASRDHPVHGPYHDHEYGFPVESDDELFERLVLEISQAGLSWLTVLKKREGYRRAFEGFDIDTVAAYGEADRQRLLADPGIIRNRLKVNATLHNAQQIVALRDEFGSFKGWLDAHHPRTKPEWVKLFKRTFAFTGGEITGEFLMSTGYLPGAHDETCPVYSAIRATGAPWMQA